jgi:flagellar protein FlaF
MAGADVIEAAIGVSLLILVGYVLVGSILTSSEIVASAQKDLQLQSKAQLGTSIQISNEQIIGSEPNHNLTFDITNTGSEIIGKFNNTDMLITNSNPSLGGGVPVSYSYIGVPSTVGNAASKNWGYTTISPDQIHPGMLDPAETMRVNIFIGSFPSHTTVYLIVTTPNGVSAAGNA